MKKSQNIYDNTSFYKEYREMRETNLNANELIEIPMIKCMLPEISGKRVLDLGCGNGTMSKYFASNGASYVLALDISKNMIDEAREKNNASTIEYDVLGMEKIDEIDGKFDLVFSSLAFHYIEDFNKLISDINNLLSDEGILLFSQEHPNVTAPILKGEMRNRVELDGKRYYLISDYIFNGERRVLWNNSSVVKYHRNFSCVMRTLLENDFEILDVQESFANEEVISLVEKYKYQNDRPYFLFVKAKKKRMK